MSARADLSHRLQDILDDAKLEGRAEAAMALKAKLRTLPVDPSPESNAYKWGLMDAIAIVMMRPNDTMHSFAIEPLLPPVLDAECFLNPGSPEARQAGCLCPVMDNNWGSGMYQRDGETVFVFNGICPVHGQNVNNKHWDVDE